MLCNSRCEQWRNLGTTNLYRVVVTTEVWLSRCNPRAAMATFVQGNTCANQCRSAEVLPVDQRCVICHKLQGRVRREAPKLWYNMLDGFSLIQCLAGDWQHDWDDFCTKLWRTADHPGPTCTSLHPAFRPGICACGSACGNSNTIGESVNCERGPAGLGRGYILYDLWGNSYLSMLSAVDASCRIVTDGCEGLHFN